jgi:hypothetical protein
MRLSREDYVPVHAPAKIYPSTDVLRSRLTKNDQVPPIDFGLPEGPAALLGIIAVLALIDSTSFGTLLIPVWLLMRPGRLRARRLLAYLAIVAIAYAAIGLILLSSLLFWGEALFDAVSRAREGTTFAAGQAALAGGLIWFSTRMDPFTAAGKEKKRRRDELRGGSGSRMARFREHALGDDESAGSGLKPLLSLGLLAVGLEIATLLPYLAAIGLVASQAPELPGSAGYILLYCLIMIAPALVLLALRLLGGSLLEKPLQKLEGFLSRHANGTAATILFILGIVLGLNALGQLGVTD